MSDNRELATHTGGGEVVANPGGGIPIEQRMALLREALTNPDVDPQKAVAMAELMFKLEDRDRKAEFNRDLIAAKAEIGPIFKRGFNTHQKTKYGKFEDIQRVTDPILHRHNLSLDYKIGSEGPNITVVPVLRHINGWVEEGLPIKGPPDNGPGRSAIQSVGSSASYLQRYAAKGTLNLRFDGEDDDGVPGRAGDQLNDRQEGLIVDAQAAADRGEYAAWYGRQSAKDKTLLITTGTHARLGGAPALPGAATSNAAPPADPPTQRNPEGKTPPPVSAGGFDVTTPDGWAGQYIADMKAAPSLDVVQSTQAKAAKGLDKLMTSHPKLHDDCTQARADAVERLSGGGAGLFEGGK